MARWKKLTNAPGPERRARQGPSRQPPRPEAAPIGAESALDRRCFLGSALAATLVALPNRAARAGPGGFRVLEAREGSLRLAPEPAGTTSVWGYDGEVPGPLLRFRRGDDVEIRLVNKLDRPATFSIQGLRVPNPMAGVAGLTQPAVAPGDSFEYRFTARDSGLSWYHSHVPPATGDQIGRGLYGALVVDEPNPPVVDRDMLVFLADWTLDDQARIRTGPAAEGPVVPLVTVNSQPIPARETLPPRSRLRLRIVSAVRSRVMVLTFAGAQPWVLAVDGAPCDAFEPLRRTIPVGPGALFDVMLDLPAEPGAEVQITLRDAAGQDPVLVSFRTEGEPRAQLPAITSLDPNPSLPAIIRLQDSRKIDLVIGAGEGSAAAGFPSKPLFSVRRGTPVTLGFVNRAKAVRQMRVHGHYVRLLHDLDDGWEPYWRNCVLVPEGKTKRVAFVADAPGKWAIEGLLAEPGSSGPATWFEVT